MCNAHYQWTFVECVNLFILVRFQLFLIFIAFSTVAEAVLEMEIILPIPISARMIGVGHHTQL
jgi:hypothetical protein